MEAGAVIDLEGNVLIWHTPDGRTGGSLPDSHTLWEILWDNRDIIGGFAHSHPGGGIPGPSWTDITTFAAVEKGLGKRLKWWITSHDAMVLCRGIDYGDGVRYDVVTVDNEPAWAAKLRTL